MARLYVIVTRTKSSTKTNPHFRIIIYNLSFKPKTLHISIPEGRMLVKKEVYPEGTIVKHYIEVRKNILTKYYIIQDGTKIIRKVMKEKCIEREVEIEVRKAIKLADILCNKHELIRLITFILANAKNVTPQYFKKKITKLNRKDISTPYGFMITVSDALLKYFRKKNLVKILKGLNNGYFRLYLHNFRNSANPEKLFTIAIVDLLS